LPQASQRSAVGHATEAILHSMPGVGPVLSRTLLGQVPELVAGAKFATDEIIRP